MVNSPDILTISYLALDTQLATYAIKLLTMKFNNLIVVATHRGVRKYTNMYTVPC